MSDTSQNNNMPAVRGFHGKRRAKSAYYFFCKEKIPGLVQEFKDDYDLEKVDRQMVMCALGAWWRDVKMIHRPEYAEWLARYEALAKTDKDEIAEMSEMAKMDRVRHPMELKKLPARVLKKRPVRKTGYIVFCSEMRDLVKSDHPGVPAAEITRILAGLWNDWPNQDEFKLKAIELNNTAEATW